MVFGEIIQTGAVDGHGIKKSVRILDCLGNKADTIDRHKNESNERRNIFHRIRDLEIVCQLITAVDRNDETHIRQEQERDKQRHKGKNVYFLLDVWRIFQWLESNRPNIAITTYDQYFNILNNHIRPYFDARGITVSKLTAGDLEDYYTFKVSEGLSPNSVIKHHAMIRTALQWGVKHRYIRENVADFAEKPGHVRYRGEAPYSVQEIAALLQLTVDEPIAVPIFLASFYGLRRSEALGLRWSAINFEQGTISIVTTVVREKCGDEIKTIVRDNTTKTDSSMRTLPLCPYTYQYFSNLWQRQQYQRSLCGNSYDSRFLDFVCVDAVGTLLQPDYVTQKFPQILDKYGLRRIRFHDLRHSCATIMLYLGYTLKDIQTWLGHSNYNFTADTYIHSGIGMHEQMAQKLAENLGILLPENTTFSEIQP